MRFWMGLVLTVAVAWSAGNLVLGALVAPKLFAAAPAKDAPYAGEPVASREGAGVVFGSLLAGWTVVGWVFTGVIAVGLTGLALSVAYRQHLPGAVLCVAALIACAAVQWSGATLVDEVAAARLKRGATAADATVESRAADAAEFDRLHRHSTRLFQIQTLLLIGLSLTLLVIGSRSPGLRSSASSTSV